MRGRGGNRRKGERGRDKVEQKRMEGKLKL